MSRSHQTFHPVSAVKLLGILFMHRCWPTTSHTIIAQDVDGMVLEVVGVINPSTNSSITSGWLSKFINGRRKYSEVIDDSCNRIKRSASSWNKYEWRVYLSVGYYDLLVGWRGDSITWHWTRKLSVKSLPTSRFCSVGIMFKFCNGTVVTIGFGCN
jgi:hypothetical protein